MKQGWEKAFTTNELYRSEIARMVLEENGINSVVINKKDSAYGSFGDIEIYVHRKDVLNAINILNKAFDE
jgi:hypothetical protein